MLNSRMQSRKAIRLYLLILSFGRPVMARVIFSMWQIQKMWIILIYRSFVEIRSSRISILSSATISKSTPKGGCTLLECHFDMAFSDLPISSASHLPVGCFPVKTTLILFITGIIWFYNPTRVLTFICKSSWFLVTLQTSSSLFFIYPSFSCYFLTIPANSFTLKSLIMLL